MEKHFQSEEELKQFLKKVVNGQTLEKCYGNEVTLTATKCLAYETICERKADEDEADFINESEPSYAASAELVVGGKLKKVLINGCAHKSIAERTDYGRQGPLRYPWTMNDALHTEKKEMQAMIQWGVLIGLHSSKYAWIKQDQALETLTKCLQSDFEGYTFDEGIYSEELTIARFKFPKLRDMMSKLDIDGYPCLLFTTNDIANCGVNLQLELAFMADIGCKKTECKMRFGDKLSVAHVGDNGISDLIDNIEQLMSLLKSSTKKLVALKERVISYPHDAIYNLLKEAKIKDSIKEQVVDDFEIMYGHKEEITAYDLYQALWLSVHYFKEEGESAAKIASYEENIARCINVAWGRIDIPYHEEKVKVSETDKLS